MTDVTALPRLLLTAATVVLLAFLAVSSATASPAAGPALAAEASWISIGPFGLNASVWMFAIDPRVPSTVYASVGDHSQNGGILKSTDRGDTWTRASSGLNGRQMLTIAVDPRSTTLYTCDIGGVVFRSDNAGASWRSDASGLPPNACMSFAVAPGAPSTAYLGGSAGVFKTTDGGLNWSASSSGLPSLPIVALAVDPSTPSTIYAAADNNGTGVGAGGLFKSSDAGATWTAQTNGIGSPRVRRIAVSPSDPRTVYVTTVDGLYKSEDGGASWTVRSVGGSPISVLTVDPQSSSIVYVGTSIGLRKTTDGGITWNPADPSHGDEVLSLAFDPVSPLTIYCGTYSSGVFRTDDGGANWLAVNHGVSGATITALGADPTDSSAVHAGVAGIGIEGIYKTADRGLTWTRTSVVSHK